MFSNLLWKFNMWKLIILSILCLQLGWTYADDDDKIETSGPAGVGVFAYQDSAGNRYGGTYDLDDAQLFGKNNRQKPGANPYGGWDFNPFVPNFQQYDDFFPQYFDNLENLLQEAFNKNFDNQRLAYNAARKAFDLTSNHAGYNPHLPGRFGNFGGDFMNLGQNSAFASGAAGPGFTHQVAAINPENPAMQNVNVMNRFADAAGSPNNGRGGYYSVSSSSYSSSSDLNGQKSGHRSAETVVNNNGEVTRYKVES